MCIRNDLKPHWCVDVCVIVLQLTCMYYYIKSAGLNAFSQYPPEVLIYYKYVSRIICAHGGVHEDRLLTQLSVCLFVLQLRSDWQISVPLVFCLAGKGRLLSAVQHSVLQETNPVQQLHRVSGERKHAQITWHTMSYFSFSYSFIDSKNI